MKNQITVTLVDNQFVLTETKTVIEVNVLTKTENTSELTSFISNSEYKSAKFSEDAKTRFRFLEQQAKAEFKLKNDVKRQERQARMKQRVADTKAKVEARIAALNEKLEKLEKSSETTEVSA